MMKKWMILLAVLLLLPTIALADEVDVSWKKNGSSIKGDRLTDGLDGDLLALAAATSQAVDCIVPENTPIRVAYVRTDSKLETVELQVLNGKKWQTVAEAVHPAAEFLLESAEPVSGKIRVLFTYGSRRATKLLELRLYTDEVSAPFHGWQAAEPVEVLVLTDDITDFDASQLAAWTGSGCRVAVASLTSPEKNPIIAIDALWNNGLRMAPAMGGYATSTRAADVTVARWGEKKVRATITDWIKQYQPRIIVQAGEAVTLAMDGMQTGDAVIVPEGAPVLEAIAALGKPTPTPEPTPEPTPVPTATPAPTAVPADWDGGFKGPQLSVVRPEYLADFENATCSDQALIPYPENRDSEGYLTEGEFLHEDKETGLWAYLSPTVQVQIVRYDMLKPTAQRYFIADVRFKPEEEQFKQHVYVFGRKEQLIYPQTLAQTSRMVIAINSDFYLYRKQNNQTLGNVIRDGKVLSNLTRKRGDSFPNLDTMALHNDGRMTVYAANEVTADEILAQGDVHDALSFGPYMIRDGELRDYKGKNYEKLAPRTAMGMIAPGHYIILVCEAGCDGKKIGDGVSAEGFSVTDVGNVLYAYGCEQGFLLDGGSTSVLVFMGEKLNRTGNMTTGKLSTPRNQHELFGVGTSELVHKDWWDGKPKK